MNTTTPLAKRIRNIRESLGYSQEYVADQMEISQQMYSKIEKNPEKTTYQRLRQLSIILKINIVVLLSDDANEISIDSIDGIGKVTIQTILDKHKHNLERMTNDILELKGKIRIGHPLNHEST